MPRRLLRTKTYSRTEGQRFLNKVFVVDLPRKVLEVLVVDAILDERNTIFWDQSEFQNKLTFVLGYCDNLRGRPAAQDAFYQGIDNRFRSRNFGRGHDQTV